MCYYKYKFYVLLLLLFLFTNYIYKLQRKSNRRNLLSMCIDATCFTQVLKLYCNQFAYQTHEDATCFNKYKYCSVVFFGRYQTAANSNFPMLCPLDNVKTFPTLTRP